jgi:hypothetical protein
MRLARFEEGGVGEPPGSPGCTDKSRRNCTYRDSSGGPFKREHTRQLMNPPFGGAVDRMVANAGQTCLGAHIDDPPAPLQQREGRCSLAARKNTPFRFTAIISS